jgi:23S rRNA pseudouridine1911/1915/1917 synthase
LSQQFREGAVEKVYWAVVENQVRGHKSAGAPWLSADTGALEDWLRKDEPNARVEVVEREAPGAQFARLLFQVRARRDGLTLLELRPHTGRKHQLRVQLAARGCPIYGDDKYGSDHPFGHAIALHARSLTFLHPTTREPITVRAEVPKLWLGRFAYLLDTDQ